MDHESEAAAAIHQWERRLLIFAFGAWAAVVAAYGQMAINRIDKVVTQLEREREMNIEAHQLLDRRVTILEQRQDSVIRALARIDEHMEDGPRNGKP